MPSPSDALSIHYISSRSATDASILALQKIADEYKQTHPNFNMEIENISDRTSYLQKIKILASSGELPDWFDADPESFFDQPGRRGPGLRHAEAL